MHLLIVHHEAEYFAGAEKMLGYFLQGLKAAGQQVTVAAVQESRVPELVPDGVGFCPVPKNAKFSLRNFVGQLGAIRARHRQAPFDLVHGWAARDWELTAIVGKALRRPAVGTLHDHPQAPFISAGRQKLMRWCASQGLKRVICVSEAVRQACVQAGYQVEKLATVRNGLPPVSSFTPAQRTGPTRLGFLGMFSQRKGLDGFFEILDQVSGVCSTPWEAALAGDAQDADGKRLLAEIQQRFSGKAWWPQVRWLGWVKDPKAFLSSLDLLICPSSEFDPFPTVLLEAGQAGRPVLAGRVGGVSEIVEDGRTGWLFPAHDWKEGARLLGQILSRPELAAEAGNAAQKRVEREFAIGRMVAEYLKVYSELANV